QSLERTFIDKVFALCDYYMENDLKLHSRHIFDIYMLLPKMNFDNEFASLIEEVREHRQKMGRCPSAASKVSIPSLLTQIIEKRVYEGDYEDITSYFQKTKVDYDEAMKAIQKVVEVNLF
ncbi:MAG: nucleotidyl transferase AbiEii/AbiGii toxin family protein, partial [Lachnospiraceae bacterium]|nr:nucleotidyl transferase AbiEii/AbiGii toxin family protein [Lachnospiraceae bacterium]